jgi:hypothetical protein
VILQRPSKKKEIGHFVSFMKNSPKVKEIIREHGYSLEVE